jgi:hypothetical protein
MKRLTFFNGSGVSPRERADAEKTYLRTITRRLDEFKATATATAALAVTASAEGSGSGSEVGLRGLAKGGDDDSTAVPLPLDLSVTDPRYQELQALYGADLLPMGKHLEGATLASDLVAITFRNLSFGSGGSLEPVTKKLPLSLAVGRLKLMVKQLFGLEVHLQLLSLRVYKDSPPMLLDDDVSTIGYFGAIDGAEIFVNEANAAN